MPKIIASVTFELREYGDSVLTMELIDHRYHIWLNTETNEPRPTVYKNRIGATRHKTTKLSLDRGEGKPIAEHMLAQVSTLMDGAKAALAAKQADEAEKHRLAGIANRKMKKAEDLYNTMVDCMLALGRGGANEAHGPNRAEWVEAQELMTFIRYGEQS